MLCLVILTNTVIVTPLLAAENNSKAGLFLNYSTSKKLVTDLKYYSENYPKLEQKYTICTEQYSNEKKVSLVNAQLLDGCNSDKKDLKITKEEFEKKYIKSSGELNECKKSKPSRVTWFTIGAITTAVVTIALEFFIIKK
jgi:hypothetical protein